jgi:hypothetical protein
LHNPWLALELGADPSERSTEMRAAFDAFMDTGSVAAPVRDVVADSWRRSALLVDQDAVAPVTLLDADIEAYRLDHPLADVMPLLRDLLGTIAYDGAHLMGVTDADGMMLWVEGHPGVVRGAENTNVIAGARWDEVNVGTTATGIALAVDHAVQIFGGEHVARCLYGFACAAAPIHDPYTGATVGSLNISGGPHVTNPHSLALVQAAARAAEAELASRRPRPKAAANLRMLGRDEAILHVNGVRYRLGRRHSEIMALLVAHPEGLSGDQLAWELHGERLVNPATLRSELSRLRQLLGSLLESRPYRLTEPVTTDFLTVARYSLSGSAATAFRSYVGQLLPGSEAPGIARLRRQLDDQVRDAVLRSVDHALHERWATSPSGQDDIEAWESVAAGLPAGSPRHLRAAAHAAQLRADAGLGIRIGESGTELADPHDAGVPHVPRQRGEA